MSYIIAEDHYSFADADGRTVKVGDRIAYAVRDGNTAGLKLGEVLAIQWVRPEYGPSRWRITVRADYSKSLSRLEYPGRIVKLG